MNKTPVKAFLCLLWTLLAPTYTFALEHWWLPSQPKEAYQIRNHTQQNQTVWVSSSVKDYSEDAEVSYNIKPGENLFLFSESLPFLHLKAVTPYLEVQFLGQTITRQNLSSRYSVPMNAQGDIQILNPVGAEQDIEIQQGGISETIKLAGYEKKTVPIVKIQKNLSSPIMISGQHRFLATIHKNERFSWLYPQAGQNMEIKADGARYFEMNDNTGKEKFVVRVDDIEMAAKLENEITNPRKIMSARVAMGSKSWNFHESGNQRQFRWSWHVEEVLGLGDFASQSCDGNPSFLEEYAIPWIRGGGIICFWNYKVKRELKPDSLQNSF